MGPHNRAFSGGFSQDDSARDDSARADLANYSRLVKPFLDQYCSSCHGATEQEADFRVDNLDPNILSGPHVDAWNTIRLRLVAEEMPPKDPAAKESFSPPHGKSRQVISWLTQELTKAKVKLLEPKDSFLPVHGNKVDHKLLFDGSISGPAATRARIWRQSPFAYETLTRGELAKNVRGIAQPFSVFSADDIRDYAQGFSVDESTAAQLLRNASLIVASQTRGEWKDGKWQAKGYPQPVKEFVRLFEAKLSDTDLSKLDAEMKSAAISKQFKLILKREPTADEILRYSKLMDKSIDDAGLVNGVRLALTAVLLTPESVFRFELGSGKKDSHGRMMLSPREIAYAISFALTDKLPDDQLLRAAAEGRLVTGSDVSREIDRILDSPKILKPRILRFFKEYFGYDRAKDVFKDSKLNPHHRADVLVQDTEQLILWILDRDQNVFEELLTTNKSFVNYAFDRKKKILRIGLSKNLIHTSYGLPVDWKWTPHQPVDLPRSERAGILTQPSWLVTMSGNFDNHPILRGKWIRERLLGGTIPDLPITVDAQLPEEPGNTLRHRMRVTREKYCWNCHQRMNPLGLAFESFDHFGRFRTLETVIDVEATRLNIDKKGKWCSDSYRLEYKTLVDKKDRPLNDRGKTIRGGSWLSHTHYCRSAMRNAQHDLNDAAHIGFRVILIREK